MIALTLAETAEVAEITPPQLRRWLVETEHARIFVVADAKHDVMLGHWAALQYWIVGRLVRLGLPVPAALRASLALLIGDGTRRIGHAHLDGRTVLLADGEFQTVYNVRPDATHGRGASRQVATLDAAYDHFAARGGRPVLAGAVAVLDLTVVPAVIGARVLDVLARQRPRHTRLLAATPSLVEAINDAFGAAGAARAATLDDAARQFAGVAARLFGRDAE